DWFNKMKKLDLSILILPSYVPSEILSEGTPKKVIAYISEITDNKTGESIGYLLIQINNKIFENLLENTNVSDFMDIVIINPNKTILYHKNSDFISTQFRSSYISQLLQEKSGSMFEKINNDINLIVFHQSSITQWTIISSVPLKTIYKEIAKLRFIFIVLIIISIFVSAILSIVFSNSITKPIFKLKKYMKNAEEGNFTKSITIQSKDEIGELSQSFNQMLYKIDTLIQKVYKTEILKKEAELNALQAQINPHFLYNTLQIMDLMAEDEGVEIISNLCQNLSKIFRYSISQGKEVIEIEKELEHAQNYINIQKVRFVDKFDVVYQVDQGLVKCKILKLMIQPLIENAILHGVENKQEKCLISVDISRQDEAIFISVKDNGRGMSSEELLALRDSLKDEILHAEISDNNRRSIGIKNVNSRIKLYFGEQYGLFIESEFGVGTCVIIKIPVTE
ncbi:MAG: sensor histidine kinase, partial [Vallitaleaceae bacterium]|nr:sensor histidine kinase [Vallitaleaceae bacterium]